MRPADRRPLPLNGYVKSSPEGSNVGHALGQILLPPEAQGATRFAAEGCAATPDVEPPATRGPEAEEKVEASALAGGILLSHQLGHACCLKAETTAAVDGTKVTVTETLSGTPCRCRCSSKLKTAVGLKVGTWSVEVKTVDPGGSRSAWSGQLTVK